MIKRERLDLFLIALGILFFGIVTIVISGLVLGTSELSVLDLIRLSLEILLVWFLVKEKQWARWVIVVLSFFGGFFGLMSFFSDWSDFDVTHAFMGLMALFYLFTGVYLSFIRKWSRPAV